MGERFNVKAGRKHSSCFFILYESCVKYGTTPLPWPYFERRKILNLGKATARRSLHWKV